MSVGFRQAFGSILRLGSKSLAVVLDQSGCVSVKTADALKKRPYLLTLSQTGRKHPYHSQAFSLCASSLSFGDQQKSSGLNFALPLQSVTKRSYITMPAEDSKESKSSEKAKKEMKSDISEQSAKKEETKRKATKRKGEEDGGEDDSSKKRKVEGNNITTAAEDGQNSKSDGKSKKATKSDKSEQSVKKGDTKRTAAKRKVEEDKAKEDSSMEAEVEETNEESTTTGGTGDILTRIKEQREKVCANVSEFKYNKKRVRVLTDAEDFPENSNGVLYWMSRDQRVQDNWAFLYAQRLAMKLEAPLYVCFCLVPKFLEATIRQFGFMMKGLAEVEKECRSLDIPFYLLMGEASKMIPNFLKEHNIGGVVTDFSPLRTPAKWVEDLKNALPEDVPLCQVDAHNIVPCWEASPKLEYGARTIRNKIHNQLNGYLTEFPPLVKHPHRASKMPPATDWKKADSYLKVDRTVGEVSWAKPGTTAGHKILESFCEHRLKVFATSRNDPNKRALSNLSPWIHFGQISVQRCIQMIKQYRHKSSEGFNAFVEEAVIRRELADNFCFYNPKYDNIKGAYDWAKKSLNLHRGDKRPYLYSKDQLEQSKTHDDLWNAAQTQMVVEGKMHGFLRMYWAKKILEWTTSPEEALEIAIYLNDKYNLDGRDPNGYVGCMWSICGIHDQGWAERAVFGKIRYMNYQGCKRKFDIPSFVAKCSKLVANKSK